jgi:two-component system chemotaxis response regulator CheB
MSKIKVMVVDDSAVMRQVMGRVLEADPELELIGAAADPLLAMERMKRQWPDVIVLDVEMPHMDGITFLRKIMAEHPTPVVICSTLTEKGAQVSVDALAAGAVAIVTKPKLGLRDFLTGSARELINTIKTAAVSRVRGSVNRVPRPLEPRPPSPAPSRTSLAPRSIAPSSLAPRAKNTADVVLPAATRPVLETTQRIVALGTSTGGTQALEELLTELPAVCPGLVIVQHMPEQFTSAFAQRLDRLSALDVREARHNDRVIQGRALIAPGGKHLLLKRSGAQYFVEVVDGPLVSRHRPSVDVLFRSVARAAGRNALGIIMTGMGDDGANGLLEMRNAGARTVAQDEESCVVYGMPKEAVKRGAVEKSLPLSALGREILAQL